MKKQHSILNIALIGAMFCSGLFSACEKTELVPENEAGSETTDNSSALKSTVGEGTFILMNRNSGKSLDLSTSTNDVIQYSFWGGSNQKWVITSVGSGNYKIASASDTDLTLEIEGASTEEDANVQADSYEGETYQQWQFADAGDGYYSIINGNSGLALSVYESSTANKGNIVQASYTEETSQQWKLINLSSSGGVSWVLTSSEVPSDVESLITSAMDAAVVRYNEWGNWDDRTLTVEYNTGVSTADGSLSGNIRFGANTSYMTERTALHEIAHTFGVGTSSAWDYPLIQDYIFVGETAAALLKTFDGDDAVIHTGGGHFWPYGLNYESEMSETNADRHVQMVWAMVQDGIYQ